MKKLLLPLIFTVLFGCSTDASHKRTTPAHSEQKALLTEISTLQQELKIYSRELDKLEKQEKYWTPKDKLIFQKQMLQKQKKFLLEQIK